MKSNKDFNTDKDAAQKKASDFSKSQPAKGSTIPSKDLSRPSSADEYRNSKVSGTVGGAKQSGSVRPTSSDSEVYEAGSDTVKKTKDQSDLDIDSHQDDMDQDDSIDHDDKH